MNKLERQDHELEERRTEQRHQDLMAALDDLHYRLDMVAETVETLLAATQRSASGASEAPSGPTALTEGPAQPKEGS